MNVTMIYSIEYSSVAVETKCLGWSVAILSFLSGEERKLVLRRVLKDELGLSFHRGGVESSSTSCRLSECLE